VGDLLVCFACWSLGTFADAFSKEVESGVESGGEDGGCGWTAKGKEMMEHEDYTPPLNLILFSPLSR
jgi:hypothetical protein